MFTTDSGFGWRASVRPMGRTMLDGREVVLSERGMNQLMGRLADGQPFNDAVRDVIYRDRDFDHGIVGWWTYVGRRNPWRMVGRVQITRTIEYGEVHYAATSMITDHTSRTLAHLLSRLSRMQFGSAARERERKAKSKGRRRRQRVLSDGEVWARRREEGWGPGGY